MFKGYEYERLRVLVRVDQARLGEELIEFPQLLLQVCEITISANDLFERAHGDYKISLAIEAARLRDDLSSGKKRTETDIASAAPLADGVIQSQLTASDARGDLQMWQALGEAMRAKQSSLKTLASLTAAGYIATGSAYSTNAANDLSQREALSNARREQAVTPIRRR